MWVKVDTEEGLKSLKVGGKVKVNHTEATIEIFAISGFITDNMFTDVNNFSGKYFSYFADFPKIPLYKWVEEDTSYLLKETFKCSFSGTTENKVKGKVSDFDLSSEDVIKCFLEAYNKSGYCNKLSIIMHGMVNGDKMYQSDIQGE